MIASYSRIFRWHVLRYLRGPPARLADRSHIALGVALYLAIQVANVSANRAFEASVDVVAGRAQLEIVAPVGNLPEELLPRIAEQPGISAATPIIEGFVSLPQFPGEYLDVLGIDIFTNAPFRTFDVTDFDAAQFDLQKWLRGPRVIAVSEDLARNHKWRAGDEIDAQVNGRTVRLTIGFLLRNDQAGADLDSHFAAIDIGWAQELFGTAAASIRSRFA